MSPFIQFDHSGNIVVQDPENKRHKFLTPPPARRNQARWENIAEFMDFIYDQYEYVRWIPDEGLIINLKENG